MWVCLRVSTLWKQLMLLTNDASWIIEQQFVGEGDASSVVEAVVHLTFKG